MTSEHSERELKAHLNTHLDVTPPWVEYPSYTRYELGWRMGSGEHHIHMWWDYLRTLPDVAARERHLRRHGPAPATWADTVFYALNPEARSVDEPVVTPAQVYVERGLVAYDVAVDNFAARVALGDMPAPPWQRGAVIPSTARYDTRGLWFHGRLHHRARRDGSLDLAALEISPEWSHFTDALRSGSLPEIDPTRGLESLAAACVAGEVPGPWSIGMTPGDAEGSFEQDMNYVDAYSLWLMCCLDDRPQLERLVHAAGMPEAWREWVAEQAFL